METSTVQDILTEAMEREGYVTIKLPDKIKDELDLYDKINANCCEEAKIKERKIYDLKERLEYLRNKIDIAHADFWNLIKDNLKPHELDFYKKHNRHKYNKKKNTMDILKDKKCNHQVFGGEAAIEDLKEFLNKKY